MSSTNNTNLTLEDVDQLLRKADWTGGELEESRWSDGLTTFVFRYQEWFAPPNDDDDDATVVRFYLDEEDSTRGETSLIQLSSRWPSGEADWTAESLEDLAQAIGVRQPPNGGDHA